MILPLVWMLLLSPVQGNYYSTCPPLEQAVYRNVVYTTASEKQLHRWATTKPSPARTEHPRPLKVMVYVEGAVPFCAQALDGPLEKQKAAVDAVLKWKFKRKRGDSKNDVVGTVTVVF